MRLHGRRKRVLLGQGALRVHAVQATEMTELILTVTMERGHCVERSLSPEFSSLYIFKEFWTYEVVRNFIEKFAFLKINGPLWGNFQNSVPKGFIATQIHILCAIFVKFE